MQLQKYLVPTGILYWKWEEGLSAADATKASHRGTKKAIVKRDNYRCVVCGRGKADGVEVQVDHMKPKDQGGKAAIENGETLCSA